MRHLLPFVCREHLLPFVLTELLKEYAFLLALFLIGLFISYNLYCRLHLLHLLVLLAGLFLLRRFLWLRLGDLLLPVGTQTKIPLS